MNKYYCKHCNRFFKRDSYAPDLRIDFETYYRRLCEKCFHKLFPNAKEIIEKAIKERKRDECKN